MVKEGRSKYSKQQRAAAATLVDLSEAVDDVDHSILGGTLFNSDVPIDATLIILL